MHELPFDMTGQTAGVLDAFNRPCALLKVNIPYEGAEFLGNVKVEPHAGVYYVWMEDGAKMLRVMFPNCKPVDVIFGNFMTPAAVQAPRTYELDIDADALEFTGSRNQDLGSEYAIFSLSPVPDNAAILKANGMTETFDTEGKAMMLLPYGTHSFTIIAKGFADYSGNVTVTRGESANVSVNLRSTKALLTIECATSGATISVQGENMSTTGRWSGALPAGSYKVEVSKQGYESLTRLATLTASTPLTLNIPELRAITGSLRVEVKPIGSTVKVDGKEMGTTPVVLRDMLIGPHNIEVSKPGYDSYSTTLTIAEGPDNPALTATLSLSETSTKMPAKTPTDYTNLSLADLRSRAEAGDPEAQWRLGNIYVFGQGVDQDDSEAEKWYRKAAEQGDGIAQYCLGVMYANGWGVTKDNSEAEKWYKKALPLLREAAKQGNADAQFYLGVMYECGRGVTRDVNEANRMYQIAARHGHAEAQTNVGIMYQFGLGVAKDVNEAVKWYRKAAAQGNEQAKSRLQSLGF